MFSQALPTRTKSDEKLLEFITDLKNHISVMVKGTYLLLPGGWVSDKGGDQTLIYVLERKGNNYYNYYHFFTYLNERLNL